MIQKYTKVSRLSNGIAYDRGMNNQSIVGDNSQIGTHLLSVNESYQATPPAYSKGNSQLVGKSNSTHRQEIKLVVDNKELLIDPDSPLRIKKKDLEFSEKTKKVDAKMISNT